MTEWIYLQRKTHCYLSPFIEVIGKVYSNTARKVWFGKSFEDYFVVYTKGVMIWYGKKEVIDDLYKFVSDKVINDPSLLNYSYKEFKKEIKKLMKISERINKSDFSKLSNEGLWKLYEDYISSYEISTVYGEPLPLVTKDIVLQHIKGMLKGKVDNINEIITVLSTPSQSSFIRKDEEELLNIAVEIQENNLEKDFEKNKDIMKKIDDHTSKYCWIPYDYGVQVWDVKHFITVLKNLLKKDCKKQLNEMLSYDGNLKKKQDKFISDCGISKELQELFDYVKLATYMMDYKKELFTKSHYLIIPLIDELAKRFSVDNVLVRFMNHKEIKKGLDGDVVSKDDLKKRFKLSVCLWDKDGETEFLEHDKVKDFIKEKINDNPEAEDAKNKLYGVCACVGRYQGKAKVVMSAMHVTKVDDGDVLIAPMTSPDYVVGMKKAGAIVTDEGGITCHAAIVSRELKIPCVVGTSKATKMFKDGDLVEVNANHASIKLIE